MKSAWQGVEDTLLYLVLVLAVLVLITMLLSFPVGAYVFNSPSLSGTGRNYQISSLPLLLFGINFPVPLPYGISFESFFVIIWAINLTLFTIMLMGPWSSTIGAIKRVRSDKNIAIYSNSALSVSVLFPATLIFAVLLEQLLNFIGLPVGNLTNTDERYFFLLSTFAPLREELGFRVCFIGIASFILAYVAKGKSSAFKSLWHPSKALSEAGIQLWKQPGLVAAIILSSLVFGAAHVIYGGGWEIGKFVSASAVGLVLGALYYTHGLPAAVMLHWGFDYYQSAYTYFDQFRGILDASGNPVAGELIYSSTFWVNFLLVVAAAAFYILILFMVLKTILAKRMTRIAFK